MYYETVMIDGYILVTVGQDVSCCPCVHAEKSFLSSVNGFSHHVSLEINESVYVIARRSGVATYEKVSLMGRFYKYHMTRGTRLSSKIFLKLSR